MGLFRDLQDRGLWSSYVKYVVEMEPVLEATSLRGMPVSILRHAEVSKLLDDRLAARLADMQRLVPNEAKKQRIYKTKKAIAAHGGAVCYEPFKPSNVALKRYMILKGHPVPKHWKTKKDTTNQDELRRLAKSTRDPLYSLVLSYRDDQTVRNNHLHNWMPSDDGRVHPTFYHTATGQLESRRPNTMNAPNHKEEQRELFRSVVQARPGHTLLSFDYKGFHALYLAWESGDKVMERVARLDLPSFATAHFLKLPKADEAMSWPDDQLRDWLKWVKKNYEQVRNAKMKHALHGYDNGMRAHGCYMRYRDYFDSKKEVARALSMLDSLFSAAFKFRSQQVEAAHEQGYLISKFGCIRYFFEVKKWSGGTWSHGDDAEAAASFIQQNHSHCHLKDVMLRLDSLGWLERAVFCTPIHDDLTFECPSSERNEAIRVIQSEMEAPNPITKLSVGVEPKEGTSWNSMRVII